MLKVGVDYNNVIPDKDDEGHHLWFTSAKHSEEQPALGDRVLTSDYEGDTCEGVVVDVHESKHVADVNIIYIKPIWDTWKDGY